MVVRGFQHLFSDKKLLESLLHKEIVKMLNLFDNLALNSSSFCPMNNFLLIVGSTILSILFGEDISYTDPELIQLVKESDETFQLSEAGNPMDFLNYNIIQILPNTWLDKLRKGRKNKIQFTKRKITTYFKNQEEMKSSLLNSYFLNFYRDLNIEHISEHETNEMALLLSDVIAGGFDTVATTLSWAMLHLVQYPAVTKRCRQEITTFLGVKDLSIEHQSFLPYFVATIYDILRLSSIGPLGALHSTIQDVTLRAFEIPQNTIILTNIWAVNHDPKEWETPNDLYPEHHLNSQRRIDPSAFNKIAAFSSGVRHCPGDKFAFYEIFFFFGDLNKDIRYEDCETT